MRRDRHNWQPEKLKSWNISGRRRKQQNRRKIRELTGEWVS